MPFHRAKFQQDPFRFPISINSAAKPAPGTSPQASRWSPERANRGYEAQGWPVGANFITSNAINQLEMFQRETFDARRIDTELGWARAAGFPDPRVGASTWCFATPEDRTSWGGMWADRITGSALADQLVREDRCSAADLDAIAPELVGRNGDKGSLWTGLKRELGELFVVRPAGTQSPRATERLDRARRYLTSGMADKAIVEVEAMPGAAAAGEWLIDARRYNEARRALDLIETAAILEPRDGPAVAAARPSGTTTP